MFNLKINKVTRRLLPLYFSAFLQGFVLWYAIEKLFMTTIGFDNATISIMVVTYLSVMLIVEIPSGLLADRWSRKGVIMLSGLALAISSLIAGFSSNIAQYMLSTAFFGVFFAFYSGTYDSIVYDTLMEEEGDCDNYERYYGRVRLLDGSALVISSILGGLLGQFIGLREVYFITIPIAILSIITLYFFKEPKLHLAHEHTSMQSQVKSTFVAITKKGIIVYLLLATILAGLLGEIVFEFNQLWLIALATPIVLYGPINAFLLSSVIIGGSIAQYFSKHKKIIINLLMFILIFSGFSLALIRNVYVVAITEFLIAIIVIIYGIIFNKQLHDRLSSNIRAGAMSAISSFTTILFIPVALGFGFIGQKFGIFSATWILVGLILIAALVILRTSLGLNDINSTIVDEPAIFHEHYK